MNDDRFPQLEGLKFRRFKDSSDFEAMSSISQKSWLADGFEWAKSREDIEAPYAETHNRDPAEDLVFVESGSEVVGYGECYVESVNPSTTSFMTYVHVLPEWRERGIREAVFCYNEARLLERARKSKARGHFETWAREDPNDWRDLIVRHGFAPAYHVLEMARANLDQIPEFPLPSGIEVRPVPPKRYQDVWNGMKEAFQMEPWYSDSLFDDEHFRAWTAKPTFEPEIWQVAWDGDRVVGTVQNYVNGEENRIFHKRVGHTEEIWVARDWRDKGIAKALISRSLRLLAELGMTEASLDVNADNLSGALHLYTSLGYRPVHKFVWLRKPLPV